MGRGRRGEGPRDPRLMSARSALPRSISFMFSDSSPSAAEILPPRGSCAEAAELVEAGH